MFFHSLSGLPEGASPVWRAAEYLSPGKSGFCFKSFEGKQIKVVRSEQVPQSFIAKVLKVAAYITVILPLIALAVRTFYRRKYTIEVEGESPTSRVGRAVFAEQKYDLKAVIDKIVQAKATGRKVALFIGRGDGQSVPQDNYLWASLDKRMENPPDEHRLHLKMDMNHLPDTKKLHKLFDKVVVDYSVIKSFSSDLPGGIWRTLCNLLDPKKAAELIAETDTLMTWGDQNITEPLLDVENGRRLVPGTWIQEFYLHGKFTSELEKVKKEFFTKTHKHLESLFHTVEFHKGEVYPGRGPEEAYHIADFWILRDPI